MTNEEWHPWEESWCEKCKTNCCAKSECNSDIMKAFKCYKHLKQESLFDDQELHNQ